MFYTDQSVSEKAKIAYEELKNDKAVFIDIRERDELLSGMVKESLWLPLSQLDNSGWLDNIKKISESKKIYLYCRSGGRASSFQSLLLGQGIKSENLGGFESLKIQNIPSQSLIPESSLIDMNI